MGNQLQNNMSILKVEQLKEAIIAGKQTLSNIQVTPMTLKQEMMFIGKLVMEEYLLTAQQIVTELKKDENILIGPGRGWMISSHVCRTLGITSINPCDIGVTPALTWGNDLDYPIINIEVDEDSALTVLDITKQLFGYENIAATLEDTEGVISSYTLLICNDGIRNHINVKESVDSTGNKYLCTIEGIKEITDSKLLRFNILPSAILSRIKRIQNLIAKNGKDAPRLYDKWIWNENYNQFHEGDLNGIPLFECKGIQEVTKMLIQKNNYGCFNTLLDIQGLFYTREGYYLYDDNAIAKFQKSHGLLMLLEKPHFPWGFLYREDFEWFLSGWMGFSWTHSAHVMLLADEKKEREAEMWKHSYLIQGINNGFGYTELNQIWDSVFRRKFKKPLPSKAHVAGRLYLSVFLARLKNEFPEEFNVIKE